MTAEARILHARSGAVLERREGPDGASYALTSLRQDDARTFLDLGEAERAFDAEVAASENDPAIMAMLGGS